MLSLLAAAGEARPVLCVVDDAQWLDTPSAEALVFTARRLRAEPVAMLFGARDGSPRRFEAPGIQELVLAGLDDPSAAAMLMRHGQDVVASVRKRLLTEAAGNPLALVELPAGLSPAQLAGQDLLPDALPLTARLTQAEQLEDPRALIWAASAAWAAPELADGSATPTAPSRSHARTER